METLSESNPTFDSTPNIFDDDWADTYDLGDWGAPPVDFEDPDFNWGEFDADSYLDDLLDPNYLNNNLKTLKYLYDPQNDHQKEMRVDRHSKSYMKKGDDLFEQEYSKHYPQTIEKFKFMLENDGEIPDQYKTKKKE